MRITGNSRHQEGGGALGVGSAHALPLGGHRGGLWVGAGEQSWREGVLGSRGWGGKGLAKTNRDPISKGSQ